MANIKTDIENTLETTISIAQDVVTKKSYGWLRGHEYDELMMLILGVAKWRKRKKSLIILSMTLILGIFEIVYALTNNL